MALSIRLPLRTKQQNSKHSCLFVFLQTLLFALSGFGTSHAHADQKWLERFDGVKIPAGLTSPMSGPMAAGWESPNDHEGLRDYAVVQESGESFLRGHFLKGTEGKVVGRKIDWDLEKHPWISWKWRVRSWATGTKINAKEGEDSTASVYVTIKAGVRANVIKYVWAVDDKIGDGYNDGAWNPIFRIFAVVIRSGGKLNEWVTEKRNFVEDFKKLYKKDPPNLTGRAIGVLTEGDTTKTEPEADYDDFQVLSE